LLYHLVFPAKYRKAVFDEQVDEVLREGYVKNQGKEYLKLHRGMSN